MTMIIVYHNQNTAGYLAIHRINSTTREVHSTDAAPLHISQREFFHLTFYLQGECSDGESISFRSSLRFCVTIVY